MNFWITLWLAVMLALATQDAKVKQPCHVKSAAPIKCFVVR
jgi:hypothetical protein